MVAVTRGWTQSPCRSGQQKQKPADLGANHGMHQTLQLDVESEAACLRSLS